MTATSAPSELDMQLHEAQRLAGRRRRAGRRAADLVVEQLETTFEVVGTLLFIIRYSVERLEEFLSQGRLTLSPYGADPAVAEVLENLRTLVASTAEGDALRKAWGVEALVHAQRHVGWLIKRGPHLFAAGMESSSQDTAGKGENGWVRAEAAVIRRVGARSRPIIIAPEVGRICRRPKYRKPLEDALIETRAVVRAAGLPPDFCLADHVDSPFRILWDQALSTAGIDWSGTVKRLSAGGAGQLGAGRWPFAEKELPRGWTMRRGPYGLVVKPHVTEPDPAFRSVLQGIVELGRRPDLSDANLCTELGRRYGTALATAALRRDHGPDATIAHAKHPAAAIRNLYAHMPAYITGTVQVTGKLGYADPGLEELHGMKVRWRRDALGRDYAEVENTVRLGTDEAPGDAAWWRIDPAAALEAFARRVGSAPAPVAVGPRQRLKPLAGLQSALDDTEYRLGGPRSTTYSLLSRPVAAGRHERTGRRLGWRGVASIATVDAGLLHQRLSAAAVDALEAGVCATLLPLGECRGVESDPETEAALAELDRALTQKAADAQVLERYGMKAKLKALYAELEALRANRTALSEELLKTRTVGATTTVPAVLAYLSGCAGQAERSFCDALREVVIGLEVVEASPASVRLGFRLAVSTDEGPLTLGPVEVTVPNTARTDGATPVGESRAEELARRFLVDGRSLDQVAADVGWTRAAVERTIREWLVPFVPSKGLRAAVMDCPIQETRGALGAHVFGTPPPPGVSREFLQLVTDTYSRSDLEWPFAWAADTHLRRRSAIAYVLEYDRGDGVAFADICDALGVPHALGRIFLDACAPGGRSATSTSLNYGPSLERTAPWGLGSSRWSEDRKRVRLARCPHRDCDGLLDHVLRVPELGASSILCSRCRRMPTDRRLVFPETYLRLWEGPRGTKRVGTGRVNGRSGTVEGKPVPVPAAWEARRAL